MTIRKSLIPEREDCPAPQAGRVKLVSDPIDYWYKLIELNEWVPKVPPQVTEETGAASFCGQGQAGNESKDKRSHSNIILHLQRALCFPNLGHKDLGISVTSCKEGMCYNPLFIGKKTQPVWRLSPLFPSDWCTWYKIHVHDRVRLDSTARESTFPKISLTCAKITYQEHTYHAGQHPGSARWRMLTISNILDP